MVNQAEAFLEDSCVNWHIRFHARRLVRLFPNSLERDDAEQELKTWLIGRVTKYYKPEKSARSTFAAMVLRTYMSTIPRSHATRVYKFHERMDSPKVEYTDPLSTVAGFRVLVNADFDKVSKDLRTCTNRYASDIFKFLRMGYNMAGCAAALDLSPAYVGVIVRIFIRELFNKYRLNEYMVE